MVSQGQMEREVQWDQWAQLVSLVSLALVSLVPLGILGSLERGVHLVEMVLQELWVCKGQRATLEPLGWGHQESQVKMGPQACLGLWELKVPRDQPDSLVHLACQVLVNQVFLGSRVTEELQVHQEPLVRRESQAQQVSLGSQVLLGQ